MKPPCGTSEDMRHTRLDETGFLGSFTAISLPGMPRGAGKANATEGPGCLRVRPRRRYSASASLIQGLTCQCERRSLSDQNGAV